MMNRVLTCSEEVLNQVPNIMEYVHYFFGSEEVLLFAVTSRKSNGFIAQCKEHCVYIRDDGKVSFHVFTVDEADTLKTMSRGEYEISFTEEDFLCVDKESRMQEYLLFSQREGLDEDGYNGLARYFQYDEKRDICCEVQYQHMDRSMYGNGGKMHLYGMHLKTKDSVFIDKKYNAVPSIDNGFVPRRSLYFTRYDISEDPVAQMLLSLRNYNLDKEDINLYYRILRIDNQNRYVTGYPLLKGYREEELNSIIAGFGFKQEIPSLLIELFNGEDIIVNEVKDFLEQIKTIKKEQDEDRMILMKIISKEE